MPRRIVRTLEQIDVLGLRVNVAEVLEHELFRWVSRRSSGRAVDQAMAVSTWRRAWSEASSDLLRLTEVLVDDGKRQAHRHALQRHDRAVRLHAEHQRPAAVNGVLTVRERHRRDAYVGLRTYLEVTPVEIPVYVARTWQARTGRVVPSAWDLTAGSGTVEDVLTHEFAAKRVVSTDIIVERSYVQCADVSSVGTIGRHLASRAAAEHLNSGRSVLEGCALEERPPVVVERPDLVFLDAPSRGTPTHAELYAATGPHADLAAYSLSGYLEVLVTVVQRSSRRLAPGGLVSVLLREGTRSGQRVVHTPEIRERFLSSAGRIGLVPIEQLTVEEPWPLKQASLGASRTSMTHLLFAGRAR